MVVVMIKGVDGLGSELVWVAFMVKPMNVLELDVVPDGISPISD